MKRYLTILMVVLSMAITSNAGVKVIPAPAAETLGQKRCDMASLVKIKVRSACLADEAEYLKSQMDKDFGMQLDIRERSFGRHAIIISIDKSLAEEGYVLRIRKNRIKVKGGSGAGVFYGIQTLLQMMSNDDLRTGTIEDSPRYAWRGFMLDEARHFFGEDKVKQILDQMAMVKLNRFHWHLSDAQSWRIEIKKYPKLTSVGGIGCHSDPDAPASFYTQSQIRDIIEYASLRHITVIPEIDMPGHATAANRAYPEYSGGGTEQFPDFTFNVGKEETYTFLTDILSGLAELFPSPYMHIGGDEVAFGIKGWETDPYIQSLMKREGLRTVQEAERYFMHRMTDVVGSLGKTLVGWDELLDLNVNKDKSIIMWWRHDKEDYLLNSLEAGYSTILCPRRPCYLDFIQQKDLTSGRRDGVNTVEDMYAFPDNLFEKCGIGDDRQACIMGLQANLWTETVKEPERLDYMMFPRLCALAESAWTPADRKDEADFKLRMDGMFSHFDKDGIYYYDFRNPERHPEPIGPVIKKR